MPLSNLYDSDEACATCGEDMKVFKSERGLYAYVCAECDLATLLYPTAAEALRAAQEGELLTHAERVEAN